MLKSYEAIYENGKLNWLGAIPAINKAKVIVVIEENDIENTVQPSIKPKETRPIGLAKGEWQAPLSFFEPLPDDLLKSFEGVNE